MTLHRPSSGMSIMIVEDEPLIRFNLVDFFEDAGFAVFEAEHAEAAIAVLRGDATIRVVITDVDMPGSMDGLKLAHYIRDRYPPTMLFVTSGAVRLTAEDMPADTYFLPKPFDPHGLLQTIERLAG